MNNVPSQRVGPVAELPALLAELGVSLDEAFAGTGIEPGQLLPEARFAYPALTGLIERCASLAQCPHLGLLLGARSDHRALGAIGDMMASAPTLGDAFRDYVGLQIGYSRGAVVYLRHTDEHYFIGYGLYDAGAGLGRQIHDLVVAIGCNMVRALTGGRVQPLRVVESVGRPDNAAVYRNILKTGILFDQEQTGIVIARHDMAMPLPGANPARRMQLRAAIQDMVRGDMEDVAARVRHALRPRLMLGEAGRATVARELGLEPRTLARHLARAGTTFEDIKDEVRFTVARELLALTRLPIGRIAEALSYSANSSFDHAFQRWTGVTPSQWRSEHWSLMRNEAETSAS
ncbi:AraC family transcriptional regulator [Ancylobacter oerskovii]|uniref:AraC family transcriptional regulator ligand-binding domain-containing protein n=1 Tax=Ancylobacter oerskovii TaxID=459519 RepID=A0ABW4YT92_9HYPH|nr:AraC family transcriptional regulator [Ancylobacter oerskovii]MBS7543287.1 AraC family transcriptional regulator ligand-binding domain-containing protein [Ancylobacter oerskovii]